MKGFDNQTLARSRYALTSSRCALAMALLVLCSPSKADEYADLDTLASGYYEQQQWDEAAKCWEKLLEQFPDDPRSADAAFFRAEALLQLGQLQAARDQFLSHHARWPEHSRASYVTFRLGETAYLLGQSDQARTTLQEFVARNPEDPLIHFAWTYLGDLALAAQDWTTSRSAFEKGLQASPSGALADRCRYGLAQSLEALARSSNATSDALTTETLLDEAARFYEFVAFQSSSDLYDESLLSLALLRLTSGQTDQANAALDRLLDPSLAAPLAPRGWYLRGRIQAETGQTDDAIASFRLGLSLVSPTDRVSRSGLAFELANRLSAQASQTQAACPTEAIELWTGVADEEPATEFASDAALRLIELAFESKDWPTVETRCQVILDRDPKFNAYWIVLEYLSRSLIEQQQFTTSAETLARWLPKNSSGQLDWQQLPDEQLSLAYLYGLSQLRAGQAKGSIDVLEFVLESSTGDSLQAGTLLSLVSAYDQLSTHDDSNDALLVTHARRYLELYPDAVEAAAIRSALCQALSRQQHWNEADVALREYLDRNPDHALVGSTIAAMSHEAREHSSESWATRWMEQFAEHAAPGSNRWSGYLQVAEREQRSGRSEEAAKWWRRLLQEAPEDPTAIQAAMQLGKHFEQRRDLSEAARVYRDAWQAAKANPSIEASATDSLVIALASLSLEEPRLPAATALVEELRAIAMDSDRPLADQALYQLAWIERAAGNERASAASLERLVQEFPDSSLRQDAAYRLAEQALRARDASAARSWLAQLRLSQNNSPNASSELNERIDLLEIQLLAAETQWSTLEEHSQRFARERSGSPWASLARFWAAEAAYRRDERAASTERFSELWKTEQDQQASWLPMVPLRLGQLAAAQSNWDEAMAWGELVRERFPEFRQQYEVDYLLGRCWGARGEFSAARQEYEKVIRSLHAGQSETAAMAQWMIGETYFHQQNYGEAITAYQRVKTLYPFPQWQAAALLQAAKCYELKNEPRQAITLYAQLLREHASSPYSQEASARLQKLDPSSSSQSSSTASDLDTESSRRRIP